MESLACSACKQKWLIHGWRCQECGSTGRVPLQIHITSKISENEVCDLACDPRMEVEQLRAHIEGATRIARHGSGSTTWKLLLQLLLLHR